MKKDLKSLNKSDNFSENVELFLKTSENVDLFLIKGNCFMLYF
jgi:hypothetical protein